MDNKLFSDFVATAYKDGSVDSAYNKFPELQSYGKQLLSDFVATAYKYGDVNTALGKFPGFSKPAKQPIPGLIDYSKPIPESSLGKPEQVQAPQAATNDYSFIPKADKERKERENAERAQFESDLARMKKYWYNLGYTGQDLERKITEFHQSRNQKLSDEQAKTLQQHAKAKGYDYEGDDSWLEDTGERDRKSTRLNSSHSAKSRMPSSA